MHSDTLAIILGGGQGKRLFPLTATRSKPAVPIGGKYRLIDVPVSSCLHADIRRIYVLTQFNSASLNRHISQTYRMDLFSPGFVEILAAEQTPDNPHWFQGTADAVRQAAAEDLVLGLEKLDMFGQLTVGRFGDQQQERLEKLSHDGRIVSRWYRGSRHNFCTPAGAWGRR